MGFGTGDEEEVVEEALVFTIMEYYLDIFLPNHRPQAETLSSHPIRLLL